VKDVFLASKQKGPQKSWRANWLNQIIDFYAINHADQIIFADERINIFFANNQIYKVIGLIDKDAILEINSEGLELIYYFNSKKIRTDKCLEKKIESFNGLTRSITQQCFIDSSFENYFNIIEYNSKGLIRKMVFMVHPKYPSLELSLK
tara:strand:- start:1978 stop:2424 length:447 start_codon:yes stop_codon:yes gene_type:complete